MVQSVEPRLRPIEDAHTATNYAPGLMEGIAEIIRRLATMDSRLGEIDNRLAGVNAMSFNHRIIGRNSRTQPICLPLQKTVPGHGFDRAYAVARTPQERQALAASHPPEPAPIGAAPPNFTVDIASYSSRDIDELIIFYNDDFGIVEDDDEAARHTKFIYIYVMLLILCRVLSACSLPETYLECNVDVEQGTRDKGPDLDAAMQDLPFSVVPLPPPPTPTTAKSLLIQRPLYKPKPKPRPTPGTGTAPPPRKRHVRQPGSSNTECTSVLRRVTTSRSTPPFPFSFTPHAHVGGPALAPVLASAAENCCTTIGLKSNTRPSPSPPSSPSSSPHSSSPSSSLPPLSPSSCLLGFVRNHAPRPSARRDPPRRRLSAVVIQCVTGLGPGQGTWWVGLKGAGERCWGDGNGRVCIRIRVDALGSLALGNAIVEDFLSLFLSLRPFVCVCASRLRSPTPSSLSASISTACEIHHQRPPNLIQHPQHRPLHCPLHSPQHVPAAHKHH